MVCVLVLEVQCNSASLIPWMARAEMNSHKTMIFMSLLKCAIEGFHPSGKPYITETLNQSLLSFLEGCNRSPNPRSSSDHMTLYTTPAIVKCDSSLHANISVTPPPDATFDPPERFPRVLWV